MSMRRRGNTCETCDVPRFLRPRPEASANLQILGTILGTQGVREFAHGVGDDEQAGIDSLTSAFLEVPDRARAVALSAALLDLHDKGGTFKPILCELSRIEGIGVPHHRYHRDHVVHSALVYCVGLYIYVRFPTLRARLLESITASSQDIMQGTWQFSSLSGGLPKGEFSFRWRLASLLHDIAYPFQLYAAEPRLDQQRFLEFMNDVLDRLPKHCSRPPLRLTRDYFSQLNELTFSQTTATTMIEHSLPTVPFSLEEYWRSLQQQPHHRVDHGVLGALVVCKVADMLYEYHNGKGKLVQAEVGWDRRLMQLSIAHPAAAIAYHAIPLNELDSQQKQWLKQLCGQQPLVGLLRAADVVQEWGRHPADPAAGPPIPAAAVRLCPDRDDKRLAVEFRGVDARRLRQLSHELEVLERFPVKIEVHCRA